MYNHFIKFKENLEPNQSFGEIVKARHAAVRSAIESIAGANCETRLIGSLQRKTRIRPLGDIGFDIDILVVLGNFYRWVHDGTGVSPIHALDDVYNSVQESDRYSKKNPEKDAPTVTLDFKDNIRVELVPTYRDKIGVNQSGVGHPVDRSYWVPQNGSWVLADYDYDAAYISGMNLESDGYLVPTIKMVKAAQKIHFPHLKSYPVEIIASSIIPSVVTYCKEHNLDITYPDLLECFFEGGTSMIANPLSIPGSNTPPITLDQTSLVSTQKIFNDVTGHIRATKAIIATSPAINNWRVLFGDYFPTII